MKTQDTKHSVSTLSKNNFIRLWSALSYTYVDMIHIVDTEDQAMQLVDVWRQTTSTWSTLALGWFGLSDWLLQLWWNPFWESISWRKCITGREPLTKWARYSHGVITYRAQLVSPTPTQHMVCSDVSGRLLGLPVRVDRTRPWTGHYFHFISFISQATHR